MEQNGTQSAYIGAESPGRLAEFCSLLVPRHTGLLNTTSAPTAGLSSTICDSALVRCHTLVASIEGSLGRLVRPVALSIED